ncbi:MAG TPA: gluconate:H+ symporter [Chitinophagaceae bacterium]|nr:gluconate:H+ symporter [Chitinophagaceae bacterium]
MTFLIIILAIGLQIFLTYKKISPFLSLLIVAILMGFCLGLDPDTMVKSIKTGVGNTMGDVALIIIFGAVLGKILEASGAAEQISSTLINSFGLKYIQWAMMVTGFLIGIPLYYNAGFVILVPLVFSIARRANLPLLYIAIPMAAALSTTHCFLPPHPGPAYLVNTFNGIVKANLGKEVSMGKTLIYGIIIAIPVVLIAGPALGSILKRIKVDISSSFLSPGTKTEKKLPAAFPSFLIGLLPVLLITMAVIITAVLPKDEITKQTILLDTSGFTITLFDIKRVILFLGDSTIALLLAVLTALWYFVLKPGRSMDTGTKWVNEAVSGIAVILLIITAGGVFKQVLQDSGTDKYIASFSSKWQMPPLLFGWMVTALLRVAIGSATVAGITAAGVVSPIVTAGAVSPELMVLAIGTGSVFGSHVNDSGFWMFKEFFNLSLKQTFLSWTVMETTISILGLIGVLILQMFVG